jgi:hypothetical protein
MGATIEVETTKAAIMGATVAETIAAAATAVPADAEPGTASIG